MRPARLTLERSNAWRLTAIVSILAFLAAGWLSIAHTGSHGDGACHCEPGHAHDEQAEHGSPDDSQRHDSDSCSLCKLLALTPSPVATMAPLPTPEPVNCPPHDAPSSVVPQSYVGFSLARGPPASYLA